MLPEPRAGAHASSGADLASAPLGQPQRIANLPTDPELRERLLALGLRPGQVVTVLRRGRPGGILHLAHGMTEFMLRRQQAAEIQVTPG
jgi:ferrous iron transport protein A